ncbi:hypothetical protein ALC62_10983 [Cyphomyrmex costatus]|uniref:Uncharacterized protein n=1 Tax=Cyphomyrmex costatus TaxID=456900 RepID=A0A151ID32_9HYME|nr:hypothetical protein ALC62_10983 [Cyphomyrmex costatus]
MLHDPADETHRKPRQLRNTPLQKYIRLASLAITLCYAGAMYVAWRKNIVPLLNDEDKIREILEEEEVNLQDFITIPIFRDTIQRLTAIQRTKLNPETESENTQAEAK